MRRSTRGLVVLAALFAASSLGAHDLFLTLGSHFVAPNSTARIRVLNGTFTASENGVARSRLRDISVASHGRRTRLDTTAWVPGEKETVLTVATGEPGTYVVGSSLAASQIPLTGKEFTGYLAEEGLTSIIAGRARRNESDKPVTERYSKHVKAVVQVGNRRTLDFDTRLGYPAELIPLNNPYSLSRGQSLRVAVSVEGAQSAGETVLAGGRTQSGARIPQQRVKSDANGVARIRLTHRGRWYVKFIHMEPVASDSIDYESKWATLTFEIK